MSATLHLTKQLIQCQSITPDDGGCQDIIMERLKALHFHIEPMLFGRVRNLWARHGTHSPLFVFAGHTDVVPPGPLDAWSSNPFEPVIRNGFLYGRGAADMKSGLAAMIVAAEQFIRKNPSHAGSIAFLITSDEEGPSTDGTKKVIETLINRHEKIDYCLVGEASSEKILGDQIRIGRRGSLNGRLTIRGKQGHVAFPERADNPIHLAAKLLSTLVAESWDHGNTFYPPTSFQLSNIHAGTGANNVIPETIEMVFNFRFGTASSSLELQTRFENILKQHHLSFELVWDLSGLPFLTKEGALLRATTHSIKAIQHLDTILGTGGGTSDGRFIAPTGAEVIELGVCNSSIHQIDEHVRITDLDVLAQLYERILRQLLGSVDNSTMLSINH